MPKKNEKGVIVLSALELDLLTVLMGGELYGLEILERINRARSKEEIGMNKLGIGSLYPTLKRMEKAKLIKGEFREPVEGEDSPQGELILIVDGRETRYQVGEWYHVPARANHAARFDKTTSEIEFWFY